MSELGGLAGRLAIAQTERDVAALVMSRAPALVGAPLVGFYSLRPNGSIFVPAEIHVRGVSEAFVDDYEKLGRHDDPLLAKVARTHAAAAIRTIDFLGARTPYGEYVREYGEEIRHYMLAPIIVCGRMIGSLNFGRPSERAFGFEEHALAGALAAHVSNRIAALRHVPAAMEAWRRVLTRREIEIAELAARGLSNGEIARALGVSENTVKKHLKRIFERFAVASRAELAMLLLRGPPAPKRLALPRARQTPFGGVAFHWPERKLTR